MSLKTTLRSIFWRFRVVINTFSGQSKTNKWEKLHCRLLLLQFVRISNYKYTIKSSRVSHRASSRQQSKLHNQKRFNPEHFYIPARKKKKIHLTLVGQDFKPEMFLSFQNSLKNGLSGDFTLKYADVFTGGGSVYITIITDNMSQQRLQTHWRCSSQNDTDIFVRKEKIVLIFFQYGVENR